MHFEEHLYWLFLYFIYKLHIDYFFILSINCILKLCLFFFQHVAVFFCMEESITACMYSQRRVPHELFLTKGVPQQISAGLEILRKFISSLEILAFWGIPLLIISLFCNNLWEWLIVVDCNCLITCDCFFFMISYLVILNNSIFEKGVPFLLQAG